MTLLEKAKMVADILHCKQIYDDKKDYIVHLEEVYNVLLRYNITDENILVSSFLHDAVEDTQLKVSLIEKYFNAEIAQIVYCVTNEQGLNRKERNTKTYVKLANNEKAIVLKLADRIANVENGLENENRKFYSMYKKEYSNFRYCLHSNSHILAQGLWKHLDSLFEYKES